MFAWIRALHIRERYIRAWLAERDEVRETLHRLEIQERELRELIGALEDRLDRMHARRIGPAGGRPRKAADGDQLPLEAIPVGDKAGLRKHFGIVK